MNMFILALTVAVVLVVLVFVVRVLRSSKKAAGPKTDEDIIDDLLQKTSRTFALAIPLLPNLSPRREVGVAYLLFRIADTFEDAAVWPKEARIKALHDFCRVLRDPAHSGLPELTRQWVSDHPTDHKGYLELLALTPFVVQKMDQFTPARRAIVLKHTIRTAEGMADFVAKSDEKGNLKLHSVAELRAYCYIVAGIVGELLTDLFVEGSAEARGIEDYLRARDVAFGEALQLVNILKDRGDDAKEGRFFLPENVDLDEVNELANQDLKSATEYVLALQKAHAPGGIIKFVALPVKLAVAALDAVRKKGAGSKVGRAAVVSMLAKLHLDVATNTPVL